MIARLSYALGDPTLRIEHVGPTAVPGTPAEDIIDLQVGVADSHRADAPDFVETLARLGFPRVPITSARVPDEGPGSSSRAERLHGSCDPGRPTEIHVRPLDGVEDRGRTPGE